MTFTSGPNLGSIRHVAATSGADALAQREISLWFDEKAIKPDDLWLDEIEDGIERCRSAIACMGAFGLGPWKNPEVDAFLTRAIGTEAA